MDKYGLVLGGGGTRGAYHIGVWEALKELGIEIKGIVGTSIGAVNGALLAQGGEAAAKQLWYDISLKDIVKIPESLGDAENLFDLKNLTVMAKEIHQKNGLDVSPFEKLLQQIIDEDTIRGQAVDFGLVTFSLTQKSEVSVFKEEIPKGSLVDFLLASSCLPGFKTKKIGDSAYVDGGISNNIPVNMLIKKDYSDIIAVDVGGVGIVKGKNVSGRNIIDIKCSNIAVGTMDFRKEAISETIQTGYFDTLKILGKTMGQHYAFHAVDYQMHKKIYSSDILSGLEYAAEIFEIDRFKIYTVEGLIRQLLLEYQLFAKIVKPFDVKKVLDNKHMLYHLTNAIVNKNYELLGNKIISGILGNIYEAASVMAYFCKKSLL